ncbi:DNA polymerase sigma [Trachipleistophora hominis]|uniref:DNA polymerase sigma n=1 Tax=Trachipleistophora hominis TaxID=72359 RepID=L7JVU2_TRAHO|nr:DNA polymerase sigma [Trachipleistophora hominis]
MQGDYIQIKSNEESRPYVVFDALAFLSINPKYNQSRKISFMDHLNNELRQFIEFLRPSDEEVTLRRVMIKRVKELILNGLEEIKRERTCAKEGNGYFDNTSKIREKDGIENKSDDKSAVEKNENQICEDRVECFGSYETGLYLPGSDIDLTLFTDEKDALKKLQGFLCTSPFIFTKSVIFLSKARIPILRFMDVCHFRYDLSLNQESGIIHTRFIKKALKQQPYIKDLSLFLKYFLKSRGLNESKRGGLCSYAQLLMLINFLNLHPLVQRQMPVAPNLSVLFMDFFSF